MTGAAVRNAEPFGLYVHVPFCEQKCSYCDFFTVTDPERRHPHFDSWLELCLAELKLWYTAHPHLAGRTIGSVFFGGGTPSLLPPSQYASFLSALRRYYHLADDAEVSLETQPATIEPQDYAAMVDAGINRFSIGVQTFNSRLLQPTARRHSVEDTEETIQRAKATGAALAMDMICALPSQTLHEWKQDLERALSLHPHHISVYEMTFHAGTQYYRQWKKGQISEADEAIRIEMFRHTHARLIAARYEHYEVSNYAKPGHQSRHNRVYWTLGDFIGLGAGAHGYIAGHRYANPRSAGDYARAVVEERLFARPADSSDPDITLVENLQMALRLTEGVNLDWLAEKLGQDIRITRTRKLEELVRRGWIELTADHLRLTEEGLLQADSVSEYLL